MPHSLFEPMRRRRIGTEKRFGRAFKEQMPAALSAFGAQFYDPIRRGEKAEIVFHNDQAVAPIDYCVEQAQNMLRIPGVEPRGGFVDQIDLPFVLEAAREF